MGPIGPIGPVFPARRESLRGRWRKTGYFLCAVTFFRKFGETKPAVARKGSREDIGPRLAAAPCDGRVRGGEVVGGVGERVGRERSLTEAQWVRGRQALSFLIHRHGSWRPFSEWSRDPTKATRLAVTSRVLSARRPLRRKPSWLPTGRVRMYNGYNPRNPEETEWHKTMPRSSAAL
jgi:hypothetical protein